MTRSCLVLTLTVDKWEGGGFTWLVLLWRGEILLALHLYPFPSPAKNEKWQWRGLLKINSAEMQVKVGLKWLSEGFLK